MSLARYRTKRNFTKTPEPKAHKARAVDDLLRFVVQKHQASHLHYDFRLEINGVLKSWVIPKGPSMHPGDKRLAMMVEDHPFDYRTFEGAIPKGNYGAGSVIIWDEGFYSSLETSDRKESEKILRQGLKKGHISFIVNGRKLHGEFSLIQLHPGTDDNSWLLIKKSDHYASTEPIIKADRSVISNKRLEDIAENNPQWHSDRSAFRMDVQPMLATQIPKPFDNPDWIFEIKWDGYRAIAEIIESKVEIYSRNFISYNQRFLEIISDLKKIKHRCILDGEIVVVDEQGRPQFQWLQHYSEQKRGTLLYYIYDILSLDGEDLRPLPLLERKKRLHTILPRLPHIHYCHHIVEHGTAFYNSVQNEHLEGIIAKRADSPYREGVRSTQWLKIKRLHEQMAVIGGFTEPRGGRTSLGALLLGVYEGDKLVYIGHTGGGFDDKQLMMLRKKLEPYTRSVSPFSAKPVPNAPVHWVDPVFVCRVQFSEWTEDGIMRQPIFLELYEDYNPKSISRESKNEPGIFISPTDEKKQVIYDHKRLTITNTSKVLWPEDGFTKQDLLTYYERIAPFILPYLYNRPESLNRHPNGIHGESFYQKNASEDTPQWVERFPVHSDTEDRIINYILCNDLPTLMYLANLGCIELNVWNSTTDHPDQPDYLVIDLDPGEISFEAVTQAALTVKDVLDAIDAKSFIKTSGKTGLHIYVPLGALYTHDQVRSFAELVLRFVHKALPDSTSLERDPKKRMDKIYLDFLQNRRGQTMAAPYSLRPVLGALMSTPLEWKELTPSLNPRSFTIQSIFERLAIKGDLWKDLFTHKLDMYAALIKLAQL